MAAILAKKIGMTQVFQEDGKVERVTVLEAGPCPVTAIRESERDGYSAVQLAFGVTKEKHLSKPELGHLKKAGTSAHKHLVEFRNEGADLQMGDTVTVESFNAGDKLKISGTSKGKGFQGTVKRHNFATGPKSHGSHNYRAPGSIGASAWPGPHGRRPHHPEGCDRRRRDRRREPVARPRRRSRPEGRDRGGPYRCLVPQPDRSTLVC
jgi:large subunit ribosomal protein L3